MFFHQPLIIPYIYACICTTPSTNHAPWRRRKRARKVTICMGYHTWYLLNPPPRHQLSILTRDCSLGLILPGTQTEVAVDLGDPALSLWSNYLTHMTSGGVCGSRSRLRTGDCSVHTSFEWAKHPWCPLRSSSIDTGYCTVACFVHRPWLVWNKGFRSLLWTDYQRSVNPVESAEHSPSSSYFIGSTSARGRQCVGLPQQKPFDALGHSKVFRESWRWGSRLGACDVRRDFVKVFGGLWATVCKHLVRSITDDNRSQICGINICSPLLWPFGHRRSDYLSIGSSAGY